MSAAAETPAARSWPRLALKLAALPLAGLLIWGVASGLGIRPGRSASAPAFKLFPPAEILGVERPRSNQLDPKLRAALADASAKAREAPLSSYPFALQALAAQRMGQQQKAERLMLRALRLEPRGSAIRTWLMTRYFMDGGLPHAIRQARVLYQLDNEVSPLVSKLLATVAQSPEARRLIVRELAGTPYLLDIVRVAPDAGLDRRAALELLNVPTNNALPAITDARAKLLKQFIDARDYAGAYAAWQGFVGPAAPPRGRIYDGAFEELPGLPPFNWTLASNEHAVADVVPSGLSSPARALAVRKFGTDPAVATSQSLLLQPGRYRLSYLARRQEAPVAATPAFAWSVVCGPTGVALARFPLPKSLGQGWTRRTETFEVTAACPLVRLDFGSTRTESPEEDAVAITSVSVDPAP